MKQGRWIRYVERRPPPSALLELFREELVTAAKRWRDGGYVGTFAGALEQLARATDALVAAEERAVPQHPAPIFALLMGDEQPHDLVPLCTQTATKEFLDEQYEVASEGDPILERWLTDRVPSPIDRALGAMIDDTVSIPLSWGATVMVTREGMSGLCAEITDGSYRYALGRLDLMPFDPQPVPGGMLIPHPENDRIPWSDDTVVRVTTLDGSEMARGRTRPRRIGDRWFIFLPVVMLHRDIKPENGD